MTKWNASQECKVGKRLKISVIQYNNRERQISQKAKTSDKIQYSFMIKKKISQQTRNERELLNLLKASNKTPWVTSDLMLSP